VRCRCRSEDERKGRDERKEGRTEAITGKMTVSSSSDWFRTTISEMTEKTVIAVLFIDVKSVAVSSRSLAILSDFAQRCNVGV
jgi:hypothetical protein